MFACNRCPIRPLKSRFEVVRHCEEQHGGFGYWCTVCNHPYTRLGKHSRCQAMTSQMVTYHRLSGATGPKAQIILEEFSRTELPHMWRAIPYSQEDFVNNAPIPPPVLPSMLHDMNMNNSQTVTHTLFKPMTQPHKRNAPTSIVQKRTKSVQPSSTQPYMDEFAGTNDPEIQLMEPPTDLGAVHFEPPVRSYSPNGRFSPHLSISSSDSGSRASSRASSRSRSTSGSSRSRSSGRSDSRSSSSRSSYETETKRHKTLDPDDRIISVRKRKLPPEQYTETKMSRMEKEKATENEKQTKTKDKSHKTHEIKLESKMTKSEKLKSNEERSKTNEKPKMTQTHVTEKPKPNNEDKTKMNIKVTIGKESERKVRSNETNTKLSRVSNEKRVTDSEMRNENKEKKEWNKEKESEKILSKKMNTSDSNKNKVTGGEQRNENREKKESKIENGSKKMSYESDDHNKVTESETRKENKEKSEFKKEIENDKTIHKKSSEIHENERKDENGEKNESKIGKESENMRNKSTENKSEKTTSQNLNGDSDDEFEVPEEEAVEWFAKNWSHNVFYNLSRGVTTLHYKGSTRPVERHETHQPLSNIAYKQFTILQEIQESRINLIVGGQEFKTSKVTLLSDPDSLLGMLFRRSCPMRPVNGNTYIFDRNPKYFGYILDFLRNGGHIDLMILPGEKSELLALLTEARYFLVKGLEKIILDRCQVEFNSRLY